jgi:hypothetical protein
MPASMFSYAFVQDREALYHAQHESYCKLSDTFMEQMRAASLPVSRLRRVQSAKHTSHSVEALETITSGGHSGHRMHAYLHSPLRHTAGDTRKEHLIEETLSALHCPSAVVFGSKTTGRLPAAGATLCCLTPLAAATLNSTRGPCCYYEKLCLLLRASL